MLQNKDVTKLNRLQSDKEDVVTIYLNCDQRRYKPEEIEEKLKDLLKIVGEKLGAEETKKIEEWIDLRLDKKVKGMAFYASPSKNFWSIYKFPCPIKTGAYVEKNVHIEQLLQVLDELERYCVVVCDKEKAKIFTVFLGVIQDFSYIFDEFPGKHDQGGLAQQNQASHTEEHVRQHLKKINEQLFKFWKEKGFDRLILAGSKEVLPELKKVLHTELKNRVVGEFFTELFKPNEHFLEQSLVVQEKVERQNEKKLVDELNNSLNGQLAVAGLKKVLDAIQERDIKALLVDSKLSTTGKKCPNCDFLGLDEVVCPYCSFKTEDVKDVVDELVQKAYSHRAKIEFVENNEVLAGMGGIGAMLRF
ncbi:MAG: host attachment protein [Patescibacteria group bacterium]|jgi:peptide subunit release factor 1 (eRF1)